MLRLLEEKIATPLGPLWVICDEQFRLRAVEWEEYSERMVQLLDIHYRKEGYERISATEAAHEKRESVSNKIRKLKTFALQLRQLFYVCQFRLHLYVLKIFTSSRI